MAFPGSADAGTAATGSGRAELRAEIDAFYAGFGQPAALTAAFRGAALLVPVTAEDRLAVHHYRGIDWLCAFTGEHEYARWVLARGAGTGGGQRYHTLFGWRLADRFAAAAARPTGVVVDIAGTAPMAFPPRIEEGAE